MDLALNNMSSDIAFSDTKYLTLHTDVYETLFENIQRKPSLEHLIKTGERNTLIFQNEKLSDLAQSVQDNIYHSLNNGRAEDAYEYAIALNKMEIISKDISHLLNRSCD